MYLSIWFGIMLAAQSGCTTQKAPKPDKLAIEEARKAQPLEEKPKEKENPLVKRLNNPSTMPVVPPAGARLGAPVSARCRLAMRCAPRGQWLH